METPITDDKSEFMMDDQSSLVQQLAVDEYLEEGDDLDEQILRETDSAPTPEKVAIRLNMMFRNIQKLAERPRCVVVSRSTSQFEHHRPTDPASAKAMTTAAGTATNGFTTKVDQSNTTSTLSTHSSIVEERLTTSSTSNDRQKDTSAGLRAVCTLCWCLFLSVLATSTLLYITWVAHTGGRYGFSPVVAWDQTTSVVRFMSDVDSSSVAKQSPNHVTTESIPDQVVNWWPSVLLKGFFPRSGDQIDSWTLHVFRNLFATANWDVVVDNASRVEVDTNTALDHSDADEMPVVVDVDATGGSSGPAADLDLSGDGEVFEANKDTASSSSRPGDTGGPASTENDVDDEWLAPSDAYDVGVLDGAVDVPAYPDVESPDMTGKADTGEHDTFNPHDSFEPWTDADEGDSADIADDTEAGVGVEQVGDGELDSHPDDKQVDVDESRAGSDLNELSSADAVEDVDGSVEADAHTDQELEPDQPVESSDHEDDGPETESEPVVPEAESELVVPEAESDPVVPETRDPAVPEPEVPSMTEGKASARWLSWPESWRRAYEAVLCRYASVRQRFISLPTAQQRAFIFAAAVVVVAAVLIILLRYRIALKRQAYALTVQPLGLLFNVVLDSTAIASHARQHGYTNTAAIRRRQAMQSRRTSMHSIASTALDGDAESGDEADQRRGRPRVNSLYSDAGAESDAGVEASDDGASQVGRTGRIPRVRSLHSLGGSGSPDLDDTIDSDDDDDDAAGGNQDESAGLWESSASMLRTTAVAATPMTRTTGVVRRTGGTVTRTATRRVIGTRRRSTVSSATSSASGGDAGTELKGGFAGFSPVVVHSTAHVHSGESESVDVEGHSVGSDHEFDSFGVRTLQFDHIPAEVTVRRRNSLYASHTGVASSQHQQRAVRSGAADESVPAAAPHVQAQLSRSVHFESTSFASASAAGAGAGSRRGRTTHADHSASAASGTARSNGAHTSGSFVAIQFSQSAVGAPVSATPVRRSRRLMRPKVCVTAAAAHPKASTPPYTTCKATLIPPCTKFIDRIVAARWRQKGFPQSLLR